MGHLQTINRGGIMDFVQILYDTFLICVTLITIVATVFIIWCIILGFRENNKDDDSQDNDNVN